MSRLYRFHDSWGTALLYALAALLLVLPQLAGAVSNPQPPLRFEENTGQIDQKILFVGRGVRHRVLLTRNAATLRVFGSANSAAVRLRPLGAGDTLVTGEGKRLSLSRYVTPAKAFEARHFARVRYEALYPGVDWLFYGSSDNRLEHDFVVAPGADPAAIRDHTACSGSDLCI